MNPSQSSEPWDLVIEPRRRWFQLHLRDLWRYRDLVRMFVWRDFAATYKQTILGPVWHIVQPVLTTLTFTVVFGRIAKLPTDELPQFLFYMSGTVLWGYLAACVSSTSSTFIGNAHIFGKVYFPRLAVPVSVVISRLIAFAIQFVLYVAVLLWFLLRGTPIQPSLYILCTPLLVLMLAGLGLGFGLLVSSLTTRYRDLQYLVGFGLQLGMYATPIIYPLSTVPDRWRWVAAINPVTPLVEMFRYAYLGAGTVSFPHLLYSVLFMCALLCIGLLLFHRVEQTFMDTV